MLGPQFEQSSGADYLYVKDLQELFQCGYSKARLMMDTLPSKRIGYRDCILRTDLDAYIDENDGINLKWPKRHR
jgi:hypothetical protein